MTQHHEEGPIRRADDIGKGEGGRKLSGRQITVLVLLGLLLLFAVLNLQKVSVDFAVGSVTLPLVVVIAVCGLVGFGAGYLVRGRREKRDRD
jgi:uncharacterized integral membrane protein